MLLYITLRFQVNWSSKGDYFIGSNLTNKTYQICMSELSSSIWTISRSKEVIILRL
jgi:hypothetical protein